MGDEREPRTLHWLTAAVAHTGLLSGLSPRAAMEAIAPDADTDTAWDQACQAFGLSHEQIAKVVAAAYRLEAANTRFAQPESRSLVPEDLARSLGIVPLRHSDATLVVATASPLDAHVESKLASVTGRKTVLAVAGPTAIKAAQDRVYAEGSEDFVLSQLHLTTAMQRVELPARAQTLKSRATPVERLIRLVLYEAVKANATLVRFEPRARGGRIGFQIDGELRTFVHLPVAAILRIMSRLRHWVRGGVLDEAGQMAALIDGQRYDLALRLEGSASIDPVSITVTTPGTAPSRDGSTGGAQSVPRALIVDDEAGDRLLLRAMLKRTGFDVMEANDGVEALARLRENVDFDVVLLDLNMPRLSGLDVLDRIRKTVRTAGMPVIVITGSEDPEDRRRLLSAGADDYLQKPINPPRVAERVKALLRRSLVTA